tara:strand:- start:2552 stop:3115 length:564 start_codon:yes stop_codon:yes gene_type:complete
MSERLDLQKEVYDKTEYIKTIDTSFSEFGVTTITEDQQVQPTVEEFFGLYNSLFYDIPALGNSNSHEYLIKTSGGYINFDEMSEEIAALQAEIAQLRGDILNLQISNIQLENTDENSDNSTTIALAEIAREIELANNNVKATAVGLSNSVSTSTSTKEPLSPSVGGSNSGQTSVSSGATSSGGGGGY